MQTVYLGLGSNLGDRLLALQLATQKLQQFGTLSASSVWETEAISSLPQGNFLNQVLRLETTVPLHALFAQIEEVEVALGKVPKGQEEPRPIDIDLLFYGNKIHNASPTVPHPRWQTRLFVVLPLRELTDKVFVGEDEILLDPIIEQLQQQKVWRI